MKESCISCAYGVGVNAGVFCSFHRTTFKPDTRCYHYMPVGRFYGKTKGDVLRAMTDEELGEVIAERIDCSECEHMYAGEGKPCHDGWGCGEYWIDFLRQRVEE